MYRSGCKIRWLVAFGFAYLTLVAMSEVIAERTQTAPLASPFCRIVIRAGGGYHSARLEVRQGLMNINRKTLSIALRMFCAMLLVSLAFAHRPAMAAPVMDMASYVLPDGSVSSLCLPGEDGKQDKHVDRGCEACRIASSIAMPLPPADAENITAGVAAIIFAFAPERFHRLNFPPNAPPRGPPSFQVSFVTA